jgi:hypothetical protein
MNKSELNPERVPLFGEPLQGLTRNSDLSPGLSLRSNPGLELANAFGV